jgi:hypothetical protein
MFKISSISLLLPKYFRFWLTLLINSRSSPDFILPACTYNILWHVRVAPLIIVGLWSLKSIYWISRKSKLHIVTAIQLWTVDTLKLNWLNVDSWILNFDWLTLYSISWGMTWKKSPPFKVLSICLQSGCLGNSRFPAVTAETPTQVGFCGNALREA